MRKWAGIAERALTAVKEQRPSKQGSQMVRSHVAPWPGKGLKGVPVFPGITKKDDGMAPQGR